MIEFCSEGSPYTRGLAHGSAFAPLVQEHIEAVCRLEAGHDDEMAELIGNLEANLRRVTPGQLDELRGIAAGAEVDLEAVMKLNYWPELTISTVGLRLCSLIAFAGAGQAPIVGKTSDHPLSSLRFFAFERVHNAGAHSYMRGTFVGTNGTRAAINDAGLALCGAAIVPRGRNRAGLPVMVTMQTILEQCASVREAIQLAEGMPAFSYGAHIMVADASGDAAVIERLPDRMAVRRPRDGVLFNTNHPLAPETCDQNAAEPALNANSQARLTRLGALTAAVPRTVEGMQSILRDHTQPGAICQHGGPADIHTTGAYVLLPAERRMRLAPGCPCQYPFVLRTLN